MKKHRLDKKGVINRAYSKTALVGNLKALTEYLGGFFISAQVFQVGSKVWAGNPKGNWIGIIQIINNFDVD